jgi:hypothetical protein
MIFKINSAEYAKFEDRLTYQLGQRIEKDMRDEFKKLPSYYYADNDYSKTIIHDHTGRVIGSEEWAVAASDTGGDWTWSKAPPMDKLIEHVKKRYGLTSNVKIKTAAYQLQRKILKEGVESEYWVDKYLIDLTSKQGNGSGRI